MAEDNHSSFTPTATAGQPAGNSSRHRRIHKEVGAITGISFVNAPDGHGVVVSALQSVGACAKAGCRVGDHVVKINGTQPENQKHAVELCDNAWKADADGTDKNKDRLKFSLHRRTQDFAVGIQGSGLVAGVVRVEVFGGSKKQSGKKHLPDTGLTLETSPVGYGALIAAVMPELPAAVAGLTAGLTIVAVDGVLCGPDPKDVVEMIDAARQKKDYADITCHLKKAREGDEE